MASSYARAQEVCESRGGCPGLPVPNKPTVSVDAKQHFNNNSYVRKLLVFNNEIDLNCLASDNPKDQGERGTGGGGGGSITPTRCVWVESWNYE